MKLGVFCVAMGVFLIAFPIVCFNSLSDVIGVVIICIIIGILECLYGVFRFISEMEYEKKQDNSAPKKAIIKGVLITVICLACIFGLVYGLVSCKSSIPESNDVWYDENGNGVVDNGEHMYYEYNDSDGNTEYDWD